MKRFLAISLLAVMWVAAHACIWDGPSSYYMYSIIPYEQFSSQPTGIYEFQRPAYYGQIARYWADYMGRKEADPYGYAAYGDTVRMQARSLGDQEMLTYTSWLNKYLDVSREVTQESWNYNKTSQAARTRKLTQVRAAAAAYKGKRLRQQYALLVMRCNMLLGASQRNITYWTTVGQKMPAGMWREAMRNIYANALLRSGRTLQACNIYMEQGDYASVRAVMDNYQNLAGIQYIYRADHNAPLLQFLIQSFANRVQDASDALAKPESEDDEYGDGMSRKEAKALALEARRFITMANGVVSRGESKTPAMWASAAAWIEYLLGDYQAAAAHIDKAMAMEGTQRMHDNARALKLMISTAGSKLTTGYRDYVAGELEWLDAKIKEEAAYSPDLMRKRNHYTDVRDQVLNGGLSPMLIKANMGSEAMAMEAMTQYYGGTDADNNYDEGDYVLRQGANTLIKYYRYITRQPIDRLHAYEQSHVYRSNDYFCDVIGTKLIAEGRFTEAEPWLKQVSLNFLSGQNIALYASKRNFTTPAWYERVTVRDWSDDGPVDTRARITSNQKLQFCQYMEQTIKAYKAAGSADEKNSHAYSLAVACYQASVYGDCWYLTHYTKHMGDSAREGEVDYAAQAIKFLNECKLSSSKKMQCDAYYALAFIPIDDWYEETYNISTGEESIELKPQSKRYAAFANLVNFLAANINDVNNAQGINMKVMKCDVLRQFINAARSHAQTDAAKARHITVDDLTYNWRTDKPAAAMRTRWL